MGGRNKIIFLAFFLFAIVNNGFAAFPVKIQVEKNRLENSIINNNKTEKHIYKPYNRSVFFGGHHKKKWLAITLCLLLGWCGMHRFYLGYYTWDDFLELSPVFLGCVVAIAGILEGLLLLFPGSKSVIFSVFVWLFILVAAGLIVWELVDLFRICTGSLKPKNGGYH